MSPVDHLARARDYLARGEECYARAADEIIAAQKEDPQLGQREIAERLGIGELMGGEFADEIAAIVGEPREQAA